MKSIITILLCICCAVCKAQQLVANGMVVLQNKPLYFTLAKAENLLQQQVLHNAIEIQVNTEGHALNTYAQVIFNNNTGRTYFVNQMSMRLAYKSSANAVISMIEVPLNSSPSLLFVQPRSNATSLQNHNFVYDLVLKPFTTFIKPDTYSFSLMITVTPE